MGWHKSSHIHSCCCSHHTRNALSTVLHDTGKISGHYLSYSSAGIFSNLPFQIFSPRGNSIDVFIQGIKIHLLRYCCNVPVFDKHIVIHIAWYGPDMYFSSVSGVASGSVSFSNTVLSNLYVITYSYVDKIPLFRKFNFQPLLLALKFLVSPGIPPLPPNSQL